jgi:hypothetical protein
MLVLLQMLHGYFIGCTRACSLGIVTEILKKEPLLIFACLWFDIYAIIFLAVLS